MGQNKEIDRHRTASEPVPDVISYMTMRKAIGILGILLPWLVVVLAKVLGGYSQKDSISAYYYSNMRDPFVGLLCMVGVFLYSYQGLSWVDDLVTNVCGLLAIGVAFFPTQMEDERWIKVGVAQLSDYQSSFVHYTCALLLFVLLACVSTFLFTKTNPDKKPTKQKLARNRVYIACGLVMFAAMLVGGGFSLPPFQHAAPPHLIFWVEAICLNAFGVSWLIKGEALLADEVDSAATASDRPARPALS
jgi:hypothetical protein